MVKKAVKLDGDGLVVSEVGSWASEKHARVQQMDFRKGHATVPCRLVSNE
jgi:hypothetical protein